MNILNHQYEKEYQSIFENALEGIFQTSLDGHFIKVNPAMARIFGYNSPEEMMQAIVDTSAQLHVDEGVREKFAKALIKHGVVEGFEARNYRKDRSIIWTRTNARCVRDDKDNILYFEGFLTDISSLKKAEFALRESEKRYRALVDRLPGVVFLDAPNDSDNAIYVSPKIEDVLGYSQEEWTTEVVWSNIIHPEDRERVLVESKRTDETEDVFHQEYRIKKKDGKYIWIREESSLVKDEHETPLFWQGFFLNISSQKQAEIAIRQSEEQFRKIFQTNPIASCIASLEDGCFVAANDAYWELSGYKPDEFIGHTSIELGFVTTKKRTKFVTRLKKEKSLRNVSGKLITKSGEIRDTLEYYELISFNGQDCIFSMFYDISEQVQSQQALQENEEKYRQLFDAESDAIFLIENISGNILEVNAAATALYGYSKEELLRKKNSDLSAEPEKTHQVTKKTPVDKEQVISIPIRFHKKKDGTIFPVEITGRFFEWRGRSVHIAAIRDITERKKVEEALKSSEERFRLVFQTSPDSININRLKDGLFVDVNEGFSMITGYTREEVVGKTSLEVNIWDDPDDRVRLVNEISKNGFVNNQESKFRTKNGRVITGLISARIITLDNALHIISITKEIETIKQTEAMLQKQLKELSILQNIALATSSSITVDELLQRTTDIISDTLFPENCGIELVTDSGDKYLAHPSYRGASKTEIRKTLPLSKGITGKVIATGKPIRLGDVSQDSAYIEVTEGVRSELCVPIQIQERIIGAINIESKYAEAYTESDERLLNTIAGTLATAIEQLRLFETTQRHLQELTILNSVSQASTRATSLDDLIENVTQIIGESLYPDNFGVLLLNQEGTALIPHPSYRGISTGKFPEEISLDKGVSGQVVVSGKPIRIANVRTHKKYIEVTSQVRSELCVPINLADRVLGVINAESVKINAFSQDDEQLLTTIAGTLATALEKLRLLDAEKQRRQEAEVLLEATTTLTTSLNLNTLFDSILEMLSRIVPYDSASIAMQQDEKLIIVAGRGFPPGYDAIGKQLGYSEKWLLLRATHQPSIVPDAQLEPNFEQWEGSEYIRGWMGVPLVVHDKLIGFINLDSNKPNAFNEKDAILAQTFANSAAVALENARLFEGEQQNHEKSEALRKATAALTTSIELEVLYEIILDSASNLVPFDSASIGIFDQGYLNIVAGRSSKENEICVGAKYLYDTGQLKSPEALREPIIIPDVREDDQFEKHEDTEYIRGWMGVPMVVQDQLVGFLNFDSIQPNFYSKEHAALAQTFSHQAAIAIENARLFQEENRRSQIIEAMANITNEFVTAREIIPALEKITHQSLELLHASTVAIYLLQDDNKTLKAVTAMGAYSEQLFSHTIQIGTGITGNIIAAGKPEIVDDMFKDSRRVTVPGTPEDDAQRDTIMSAPLILRGKPIGAINAWRLRSSGLFRTSELNFLVSIANQTSMLIESIRLFQDTARHAQEAHAIAEVGRDISSTLQLDVVLERIARYAKDLLRAETSAAYLLNPKDSLLRAIAAIGEDAQEIKNDPLLLGKGILGNIALQKSGEIVNNTMDDDRSIVIKGTDCNPNEHLMGVPVLSTNQVTGLLAVWRTGQGEEFKLHELDFLSSLAQQAAVAIENARLFEAEQRSRKNAEALRESATALTNSIQLESLYEIILDSATRLIPFDSASIEILDQGYLEIVAGRGSNDHKVCIGERYPYDATKWGDLKTFREPIILPNVQEDERFEKLEGTEYIRGWMGVPLVVQDILVGFFNFDSSIENFFTSEHASLAQTFGNQVAIAIENARLFGKEQTQRQRNAILLDLMRVAASSLAVEEVMQTILERISDLVPCTSGTIQLLEGKNLRIAATIGPAAKALVIDELLPISKYPLNEKTIKKRVPIYIPDTNEDPDYVKIDQLEFVRSFLVIPLVFKNKAIGLITLDSQDKEHFTEQDIDLTLAVARHATIAIENARLFEAEQQRHRESETLRQAALAITTSLKLESVLETILIVMKQVIPYDSASVLLEEDGHLHIAATQGFPNPDHLLTLSFPVNDKLYQEIKNSKQAITLRNAQNDKRFQNWGEASSVKGWIGTPLTVRDETIGCITIDSQNSDAFDTHLAALAQAFANQAALAIQNARQFEAEQRHFQESETLRKTAEAITSSLDIRQVLNAILNNLSQVVPFDSAALFLIEGDLVRLTAGVGFQENDNIINSVFPANNALLKKIWETKKPLILENAQADSRFEKWATTDMVCGWMGIPLTVRDTIIGFITIDSYKPGIYNEHAATLATTFAHQAAAAIENARLFERSEKQISQLTVLRDIDNAISSSFDLQVTLNLLIGYAIRELNADAAAILLYDADLMSLSLCTSTGFTNKSNISRADIRVGQGLAGRVALRREFVQITDLSTAPELAQSPYVNQENFKSYFGVPLIGKGQIKGVLEIYTRNETNPSPDWQNFLHTLAGQAVIAIDNAQLFKSLLRSNQELMLAYDTTLAGWGQALELRDKETQGHTDRVVQLTFELARSMGIEGEELTNIMRGALLHDIGKMGIPDHILHKPGPFTEEEWEIMRQHPQFAFDLINPIPYLRPALDIPYSHHERWDGSGYPRGLKGEDIPLAARIFAVIDIWDALLNKRVYRDAWPEEKVIEYLKNAAGIELDPDIVETFLELIKEEKNKAE